MAYRLHKFLVHEYNTFIEFKIFFNTIRRSKLTIYTFFAPNEDYPNRRLKTMYLLDNELSHDIIIYYRSYILKTKE